MNKRRVMVVLCVIVLATSAVALSGSASSALSSIGRGKSTPSKDSIGQRQQAARDNSTLQPTASQEQPSGSAQPQVTDIPRHVIYGLLFRESALFKKKAHEQELKGADGTFFREYHKNKLKLSDAQSAALDRVADDTNREVTKLDKKARKLIDDIRAEHPGGRLKEGEVLPPPPAELTELENQRTNVIMQAREQLRAALGETEFQRLEGLLLEDAAKTIKVVPHGGSPASFTSQPGTESRP